MSLQNTIQHKLQKQSTNLDSVPGLGIKMSQELQDCIDWEWLQVCQLTLPCASGIIGEAGVCSASAIQLFCAAVQSTSKAAMLIGCQASLQEVVILLLLCMGGLKHCFRHVQMHCLDMNQEHDVMHIDHLMLRDICCSDKFLSRCWYSLRPKR